MLMTTICEPSDDRHIINVGLGALVQLFRAVAQASLLRQKPSKGRAHYCPLLC
jgi:hypothetical protein